MARVSRQSVPANSSLPTGTDRRPAPSGRNLGAQTDCFAETSQKGRAEAAAVYRGVGDAAVLGQSQDQLLKKPCAVHGFQIRAHQMGSEQFLFT